MANTVKQLIQSCLPHIGLPRDPIQDEVRDIGIAEYNMQAKPIFDAWPWDNAKLPEFEVTSDANGIITFASTVDVVRFVRPAAVDDDGYSEPTYHRDEIMARQHGTTGQGFESYPDDASRNRRIKVPSASTAYKVLALFRFVEATSANWDTVYFPIDRAEVALREFLLDAFRIWAGHPPQGRGNNLLNTALGREVDQSQRERRVAPREGMFKDVGSWW